MRSDIVDIDVIVICEISEKPVEQGDITVRGHRQMHIRQIAARRRARINVDDAHFGPCLFGRSDALVQHRMTPREVGADQHDQVCFIKIGVGARHRIGAKRAFVPRHGGCHAQP